MSSNTLIDLDELLIKVRAKAARAQISESLACYQAGAYRAAVVSVWTAVVFDIIQKLRDLEIGGDANAKQYTSKIDGVIAANDIAGSLAVEREILTVAFRDFELLTTDELLDLQRLQEDRNRCAHPSMDHADDIYIPPPELVRLHLRTALESLLTRPPRQGKAAFDRLVAEVTSPLFPTVVTDAVEVLAAGPLRNPRESLLRNFIIASIKEVLLSPRDASSPQSRRVVTALNALRTLHPEPTRRILEERLPDILRRLDVTTLPRLLIFTSEVPELWSVVPNDVLTKLRGLVESSTGEVAGEVIPLAASGPSLEAATIERTRTLTRDELRAVMERNPKPALAFSPFVERAVELFVNSRSWDSTNAIVPSVMRQLVPVLNVDHVAQILRAAVENVDVRHAFETPGFLRDMMEAGVVSREAFTEIVTSTGAAAIFSFLAPNETNAPEEIAEPVNDFQQGQRVGHRLFGPGTIAEVQGSDRDLVLTISFDEPTVGTKRIKAAYTTLFAAPQ